MLISFALAAVYIIVIYLAGRYIRPVREMYVFFFGLIGKPLDRIAEMLEIFRAKQASTEVKYPGLRTIILSVALVLATATLVADVGGSVDALQAFGLTIPDLSPLVSSLVNSAIAVLFITTSCIWGALYIEKIVPEEARIFTVPQEDKEKFQKLTSRMFTISVIASVCFFALRPVYQSNPDSNVTHLLQWAVYGLIGVLVPLTGMVSLFIIGAGLQAVLSLVLTIVWFAVSILADICNHTHEHFTASVLVIPVPVPELPAPESEPVPALPAPTPFAGRKREEFPIIDNGKEHFAERANLALDEYAKVPRILQEVVEYLPKIEWDETLNNGNSWKVLSNGMFGYDLSDEDTRLFVIAHETGHVIHQKQNNDSSEEAANRYAHEVMIELGRA